MSRRQEELELESKKQKEEEYVVIEVAVKGSVSSDGVHHKSDSVDCGTKDDGDDGERDGDHEAK